MRDKKQIAALREEARWCGRRIASRSGWPSGNVSALSLTASLLEPRATRLRVEASRPFGAMVVRSPEKINVIEERIPKARA